MAYRRRSMRGRRRSGRRPIARRRGFKSRRRGRRVRGYTVSRGGIRL